MTSHPRDRATSATNQVSGQTHGDIVQASSVGAVHIHQRADAITMFLGPVDASCAHFGADQQKSRQADEVAE